ncbi:MAG: inositol monophosphatase family protein [Actinomycetes bacterium]
MEPSKVVPAANAGRCLPADHPLAADLSLALALADAAAEVTRRAFGGRQVVRLKADATPVTEVDAAAEDVIRDILRRERPADGVCGEEAGDTPGTSGRTWVVDPIDGTQMFAEGIPLWSTLIGLKVDDEVVVGVADAPALGERYQAVRGGGAFCNDQPIRVSEVRDMSEALVLHAPLEEFIRKTGLRAITRVSEGSRVTRGIGDGWAHLLVARGAADALVEQGPCYEWDWAATSVIVSEAGGSLTRLEGGAPTPGCHLLVSNGLLDAEIRQTLLL